MSEYITSLKKNIKNNKTDEAKKLLEPLASKPEAEQLEVVQLLALAPDKVALELLHFLTSPNYTDTEFYGRLIQLITDRAHLNFQFLLILLDNADIKTIQQSIPLIRHILNNETDKTLLNKIIRAIGKLKIKELVDDLAEFIFYDDEILKQESVKALERIGNSNACEKLIQASETEKCDQNILDAIQVLSSNKSENKAEPKTAKPEKTPKEVCTYDGQLEQLASTNLHERFKAFTSFAQDSSQIAAELTHILECGNHDLAISMLRLTERTIPMSAVNDLFEIISQKKIDNTIKFAAYSALNAYPELKSAASVIQGLSESALFVRLAAIQVLDRNLSDFVCAEIKTKIESGTKKGETLAENILDARAANIIEHLMASDSFNYIASNYLARSAPIPVLDTFIKILEKRKLKSTTRKYIDLKQQKIKEHQKPLIVISSSKAVLKTYDKLIYGCGLKALGFQHPQEAFEAFLAEKPAAIICDLFLHDMLGTDIAREARELYPVDEVPFILSTFQRTLDKIQLAEEMKDAGVNMICEFPPKTSQIKSWIK